MNTAMALFTLTLFRYGRMTDGATYFEDVGQRSPVQDVATIMQYDMIGHAAVMASSQQPLHGTTHCIHRENPQTDTFSAYRYLWHMN